MSLIEVQAWMVLVCMGSLVVNVATLAVVAVWCLLDRCHIYFRR